MPIEDDEGHQTILASIEIWQRIKDTQRRLWGDYIELGTKLQPLRDEAWRRAGSPQPKGKAYNREMSKLLKEYEAYGLDMDPNARAALLHIMDNLEAVQEWRARQDDPDSLNYPRTVWEKFEKSRQQNSSADAAAADADDDADAASPEEEELQDDSPEVWFTDTDAAAEDDSDDADDIAAGSAIAIAALRAENVSSLKARVQQLEADLEAARERIGELEAAKPPKAPKRRKTAKPSKAAKTRIKLLPPPKAEPTSTRILRMLNGCLDQKGFEQLQQDYQAA
jgi:hypothetical protein